MLGFRVLSDSIGVYSKVRPLNQIVTHFFAHTRPKINKEREREFASACVCAWDTNLFFAFRLIFVFSLDLLFGSLLDIHVAASYIIRQLVKNGWLMVREVGELVV